MNNLQLEIESILADVGQQHLLAFMEQLDDEQRVQLLDQIGQIDFEEIRSLFANESSDCDWSELASRAEPPAAIALGQGHEKFSRDEAIDCGEQLLRDGKVGMILVAGGQGSRLGFDKPKGMYPIGPISNNSLFQVIFEKVLGYSRYYGKTIPLFVMSSPATDQDTVDFLTLHHNFGIPADDCQVFCQGTMPAVDRQTGNLLLAAKDRLFTSPDGHGGMVAALQKHGCLQTMQDRGIETIFYGQIDNPLMQVCDPLTIGYHKLLASEMTSQVVRKSEPLQRVGNLVSIDGRVQIIEYSDLPPQYAEQTDEAGNLKLWAGSIAVHAFETSFLKRVVENDGSLPFHRAYKKVPFVDEAGNLVDPSEPNAVKFEKFIFDLLPFAANALAIEVDPADGFAAVKNAPPATTETAETTKAAMVDQHKRWLNEIGVTVDSGVPVEISPLFAIHEKQLAEKMERGGIISEPTYLV